MQNLSIKTRLLALMGLMALLIVAGSAVGITGLSHTKRSLEAAYADHLKPAVAVARLQ